MEKGNPNSRRLLNQQISYQCKGNLKKLADDALDVWTHTVIWKRIVQYIWIRFKTRAHISISRSCFTRKVLENWKNWQDAHTQEVEYFLVHNSQSWLDYIPKRKINKPKLKVSIWNSSSNASNSLMDEKPRIQWGGSHPKTSTRCLVANIVPILYRLLEWRNPRSSVLVPYAIPRRLSTRRSIWYSNGYRGLIEELLSGSCTNRLATGGRSENRIISLFFWLTRHARCCKYITAQRRSLSSSPTTRLFALGSTSSLFVWIQRCSLWLKASLVSLLSAIYNAMDLSVRS